MTEYTLPLWAQIGLSAITLKMIWNLGSLSENDIPGSGWVGHGGTEQ